MRPVLFFLALTACAPAPDVLCQCSTPGEPRGLFEGRFTHSIEAIEVLEGDYIPPALPPARHALGLASEDFFVWALDGGEAHVVLQASWVDVRETPGSSGGCCPGWDGLTPSSPQPEWSARNRARLVPLDLGDTLTRLDGSLALVEPILTDRLDPPLVLDGDARGFVLRAEHYVHPAGCSEPACAARVRVIHHFRRPD